MGIDRRSFMKFAAGAGVGVAASPLPWKLLDDVSIWSQNWPWIPSNPKGESTYALTTSKYCPSGCGMKIRLVDGRPVRALADPDHPLGGGISAMAAAELQLMYSPARVKFPLRRSVSGELERISWKEAEQTLVDKLGAAKASLTCVSGDENGSSLELLSAFLRGRGSSALYLMPSDAQAAGRAWGLMGGKGQVGYDLENSDFILAVGANILESWGTFIRNRRLFAAGRPHGEDTDTGFIYAGAVQNGSATAADRWIPLRPGSELVFLLGLAALLTRQGRVINAPDFIAFREMLAEFAPQKVSALTGVSGQALQETAALLLKASNPVVLTGTESGHGGGAAQVMAGLALNLLLSGETLRDIPLSPGILPGAERRTSIQSRDLAGYISMGKVPQSMLFYEANPAYALPNAGSATDFIRSVPFKAAFTPFLDETAMLCDLVLPTAFSLERLDDLESPYGCSRPFYAFNRKFTEPQGEARAGTEAILSLSAKLGNPLAASSMAFFKAKATALGANLAALDQGEVFEGRARSPGEVALLPHILRREAESKNVSVPVILAPLRRIALGSAQSGIPPFSLKTVRAAELMGNEICVLMNRSTAYSRDLKERDRVRVSAGQKSFKARVRIFEGIVSDAVALTLGFGHTALDAFSRNKGANVAELLVPTPEAGTGLMVWNQVGVSLEKV